MSRPIKEGLYYFPFDIDFFDDPKVLFVENKYGEEGELIVVKLLSWIYRNGYYTKWNEDFSLLFAKRNFTNIKSALVNDVVGELLKRGFFNESIFKSFGVLTSKGIQKRWQLVIDKSRRKARIKCDYDLLNLEEIPPKQEETIAETEESTQSKVNKSKVNKSRVNKSRVKHKYGNYKHVLLSDDDLQMLRDKFPDYLQRITNLDEYIETSGKSYKNHYLVIVRWSKNDERASKPKRRTHTVSNEEYRNE